MNRQICLFISSIGLGVLAGFFNSLLDLSEAAGKSPIVLSIFMAALFVRLARGVPPFPFEKIEHSRSKVILASLIHLKEMYSQSFASFMAAIVVAMAYSAGYSTIDSELMKSICSGILVFLLSWSVSAAYLIYSTDIKLFHTQIDAMEVVVDDAAIAKAETTLDSVRESFNFAAKAKPLDQDD